MPAKKQKPITVKAEVIDPRVEASKVDAQKEKSASFWGKGGSGKSTQESSALVKETNSLNLSFVPGISSSNYRMQAGLTTAGNVMPPMVKGMLSTMFKSVGLDFCVDDICLAQDNSATIKKIIEVTDMITQQSELLPALQKAIKAGLKGAKKFSQFNRNVAISTLQAQSSIDSDTADVLLAMGGYAQRKNATQMRLELGLRQIQQLDEDTRAKIDAKWGKYYNVAQSRKQVSLQVAQSLEKRQIASAESNGNKKIERNAKASDVETHKNQG